MSLSNLPEEYFPFKRLIVCSNPFYGSIPIAHNTFPMVLVGKGKGVHPSVWIYDPVALRGDKQVYVVQNNETTFERISILFSRNSTTVLLDQTVIIEAESLGEDDAEILVLDLRPFGLKVYGNKNGGLHVGANILQNNSFIVQIMISLRD